MRRKNGEELEIVHGFKESGSERAEKEGQGDEMGGGRRGERAANR